MNKISKEKMILRRSLYILLAICSVTVAFADEPRSALDNAPSVEATAAAPGAAAPAAKETVAPPEKSAEPAAAAPVDDGLPVPQPAAQESYVYDLKRLINKSRENIRRVNDKIKDQAVMKRNQKREERAREYYQRGIQLNEEGKFDDAREYFEKAIRITEHPEMMQYIQKSEYRLKAQEAALRREEHQQLRQLAVDEGARQREAQQTYVEAVRLYKEKKFKEAKEQFEHVEELMGDFKGTRSYLRILDQDILRAEALAAKQQRLEMERQHKDVEAARQREKDEWKKEIDRKEAERRDQVNKQAQAVYEQALTLYKEKKFTEAKKKWQEVEWVIPDYKATRNYLSRIDKDIFEEEKRLNEQKAKEEADQLWQDEVARSKKEIEMKKAAEAKEKEAKRQVEEQANFLYQAAVTLFDKRDYDAAEAKFNEVVKVTPDYKATNVYIAKIAQARAEQARLKQEKELQEAREKAAAEAKAMKEAELAKQRQQEEELRRIYEDGLRYYDNRKYSEAKEKFIQLASRSSHYKKVDYYFRRADELQRADMLKQGLPVPPPAELPAVTAPPGSPDKAPEVKAARPATPAAAAAAAKAAVVKENKEEKMEQIKQIQELGELVQICSQLYQQMTLLSDDRNIIPVKRKMEQIIELLNAIMAQSQRILRELKAEEERAAQEALKARMEQLYDEAIQLLREGKFEQARAKFLEIESKIPNFKATRQYLSRIEHDRDRAAQDALKERTRADEQRLKQAQEKERAEVLAQRAKDQERMRRIREEQEALVKSLVAQASAINDEILAAAKRKDFDTVKVKLGQLGPILEQLLKVKKSMMDAEHKAEMKRHWMESKSLKTMAPTKMAQIIDDDHTPFRNQEAAKELEEDFHHGVLLIEKKQYAAAKVVFERLAEQNDPRAQPYLRKIRRALEKEILRVNSWAEKERKDFIAEHARREKQAVIMSKLEAEHQRAFAQELDRQRRSTELRDQQERTRLEALKVQEQERARIAQRRKDMEQSGLPEGYDFVKVARKRAEKEAKEEAARRKAMEPKKKDKRKPAPSKKPVPPPENEGFVKVAPASGGHDQEAHTNNLAPSVEFKPVPVPTPPPTEPPATEPPPTEPPPVTAAESSPPVVVGASARNAQEGPSKAQIAAQERAEAERLAQEKAREEFSRKRKEFLELRYRKQQMEKIQKQKMEQEKAEREAREQQQRIENERMAIKQRLMDGAKVMYGEAMRLYKKKNYAVAAAKFQSIEEIMPGYKQTRLYLDRARQKVLEQSAVSPLPPVDLNAGHDTGTPSRPQSYKSPMSMDDTSTAPRAGKSAGRDDAIQKTLDIFDPNAS